MTDSMFPKILYQYPFMSRNIVSQANDRPMLLMSNIGTVLQLQLLLHNISQWTTYLTVYL